MIHEVQTEMQAHIESSRQAPDSSDESVGLATGLEQCQYTARDIKRRDGTIVQACDHHGIVLCRTADDCVDCNEVTEDHGVLLN